MRNSKRTRNQLPGSIRPCAKKHPTDAFVKVLLADPALRESFGMALLDDLFRDETGAWNDHARRVLGPIVEGDA